MRPMSETEYQDLRQQFDTLLTIYVHAQRAMDQIPQGRSFNEYTPEEREALMRPMLASNELFHWALENKCPQGAENPR